MSFLYLTVNVYLLVGIQNRSVCLFKYCFERNSWKLYYWSWRFACATYGGIQKGIHYIYFLMQRCMSLGSKLLLRHFPDLAYWYYV